MAALACGVGGRGSAWRGCCRGRRTGRHAAMGSAKGPSVCTGQHGAVAACYALGLRSAGQGDSKRERDQQATHGTSSRTSRVGQRGLDTLQNDVDRSICAASNGWQGSVEPHRPRPGRKHACLPGLPLQSRRPSVMVSICKREAIRAECAYETLGSVGADAGSAVHGRASPRRTRGHGGSAGRQPGSGDPIL